jgi:hypothetical protein
MSKKNAFFTPLFPKKGTKEPFRGANVDKKRARKVAILPFCKLACYDGRQKLPA